MTIPYAPTSWNPTSGCSVVSPGCANCWAETVSHRFSMTHLPWTPEHAAENVVTHPARLDEPLRWRKPRTVAVCFMGDLFHEQVPFDFLDRVFETITDTPQHTYLILTKRAQRMRDYFHDWRPTDNVFLGVTAENQRMADERIPLLLDTPAAHRWASLEPLLGPVDVGRWLPLHPEADLHCGKNWPHKDHTWPWPEPAPWAEWKNCPGSPFDASSRLDGVVVGGESGPAHRPMDLQWAADIYAQCHAANVPCYFKQIAASRPGQPSGVAALDSAKETPWQR